MFDWLTYEHKTVRLVRGSGRKAMEKLSAEGWELVSQESGALRKAIKVRRIRTRQGWLRVGGGAVAATALVTVIAVGAALENDSTGEHGAQTGADASAADDVPSTPKPPRVASSLHPPMVWGHWKIVGDRIRVDEDLYGSFDPDFEVVNTGEKKADGYFTVSFLKNGRILGRSSCTTNLTLASNEEVRPGAPSFVKCDSDDRLVRGWTEITIESGESYDY